jgi:hypothetical protein
VIIWGTSTKTFELAMLNLLCAFCGNPSAHSLRKRVTKFTLFFIPLFPISPAKFSLQCTFCGGTNQITKENADQLLGQAGGAPQGGQQPYQQGQPPAPAYAPAQPPQQGYGQIPPQGNPFAGGGAQGQPPQNPYQG